MLKFDFEGKAIYKYSYVFGILFLKNLIPGFSPNTSVILSIKKLHENIYFRFL